MKKPSQTGTTAPFGHGSVQNVFHRLTLPSRDRQGAVGVPILSQRLWSRLGYGDRRTLAASLLFHGSNFKDRGALRARNYGVLVLEAAGLAFCSLSQSGPMRSWMAFSRSIWVRIVFSVSSAYFFAASCGAVLFASSSMRRRFWRDWSSFQALS